MNIQEAAKIIGYNAGNKIFVKNMVRALNMCAWLNTKEEWQRLAAGEAVLRDWQAYLNECQAYRNKKGN